MSEEQAPDRTPPRPLADVEREILASGDLEVLIALAAECQGEHHWRPLKMPLASLPFVRPRVASYCQRCKLVDLDGRVFWPVLPPGVGSQPS